VNFCRTGILLLAALAVSLSATAQNCPRPPSLSIITDCDNTLCPPGRLIAFQANTFPQSIPSCEILGCGRRAAIPIVRGVDVC